MEIVIKRKEDLLKYQAVKPEIELSFDNFEDAQTVLKVLMKQGYACVIYQDDLSVYVINATYVGDGADASGWEWGRMIAFVDTDDYVTPADDNKNAVADDDNKGADDDNDPDDTTSPRAITLNKIKEIWDKYPQLRLGQLICNVVRDPLLYYIDDEDLVEKLEGRYVNYPEPWDGVDADDDDDAVFYHEEADERELDEDDDDYQD